ncbi:MAG TPA: VWA domain-containing protein [Pyrinomonadaceae bacterium]|nr:VWA domain-containing protein [Pyrinomonadaceae bacterium]
MKITLFGIFVVIFLFGGLAVHSQSRRTNETTNGGKANRRSGPTPTPIPSPEEPDGARAQDDGEVVTVETDLVSIPVRVLDHKGRFIGGLQKENFKVFEDGAEQELAYFTNESQPFTVALVMDMSYSTTFKISEIQLAAISFIDQLRPSDKVIVVVFDTDVHVLCEATTDRSQIYKAINMAKIGMGTSLYEAVSLVVNDRLRRVNGRKAMVLFTDGVDTTSESSYDSDNLRDALESETLIYPIRYDTYSDVQKILNAPPTGRMPGSLPPSTAPTIPVKDPLGLPFPLPSIGTASGKGTRPEDYQHAEEYLGELAVRTGGTMYLASSFDNLTGAFRKIASELREYYSIGYYPKDMSVPGKVRKLRVITDQKGVAVRARTTFIAPDRTKGPKKKSRK